MDPVGGPRGRRATRFASAVIVLSLAGVLVSCGKSGGTGQQPAGKTAAQYVAGACAAMTSWGQDFKTAATDLQSQVTAAPTLAKKKDIFVSFMKSLTGTTDTLIQNLQGLGTPAVDGGKKVSQELVAAFQRARGTLASAQAKAEALPTHDVHAFKTQVTEIGNQISSLGDAFNGVGNMSNGALDKAFEADPTCKQMQTIFS